MTGSVRGRIEYCAKGAVKRCPSAVMHARTNHL